MGWSRIVGNARYSGRARELGARIPKLGTDEFSVAFFGQPDPRFESGKAGPRVDNGANQRWQELARLNRVCARLGQTMAAIAIAITKMSRIRCFL